jgi:hypothetical protein
MFIRSRANPSIIGILLAERVEGWNAVKLKTADIPYKGEYGVGALFNYTPKGWSICERGDIGAINAYSAWCALGKPMNSMI